MQKGKIKKYAKITLLTGSIVLFTGYITNGYFKEQNHQKVYQDYKFDMQKIENAVTRTPYLTQEEQTEIMQDLQGPLSTYKNKEISAEELETKVNEKINEWKEKERDRKRAPNLDLSSEQHIVLEDYQKLKRESNNTFTLTKEQIAIITAYDLIAIENVKGGGIACLLQDGTVVYCSSEGKLDSEYIRYLTENNVCTAVNQLEKIKSSLKEEQTDTLFVNPVEACNLREENTRAIYRSDDKKQMGHVSYVQNKEESIPIYWNTVYGYVSSSFELFAAENALRDALQEGKYK